MSANLYIILPFYFFLAWGIDQKYKIQIVPQKNRKNPKIFENPRGGTQYQSVGDKW